MTTVNGNTLIQDAPEPIAIVSAACRLPGHVNSPHKLWQLLQSGGIAVSNIVPKSRFRSEGHFDGSGKPGTMKALSGMFIEDIDPAIFDASFFNLTRADAIAMEPQQRQLLEVIYECFENGGIPIEEVSGKQIGCFVGSMNADYHDMQNRDPEQRTLGMTAGSGRTMLSNRISHFFNLQGASVTVDTACSSGLVGLDIACQNLRAGTLAGAVVAGVNLWLSPEHTEERGTMRAAYSSSGKCHTFDVKADGYCRAEAVNAVYLKRLSDAIRDGDPIRAVIRGTANNSNGWTQGINSPSAEAQAAVIRAAYNDAGIDSSRYAETGYLECHGTGTPAGDPLEVKGAASVLAHMRPQSNPLIIGSVKSNIGHSEPGAGLSGLIKAMLAVEEGKIPGNPTFFTPSPNIDFDGLRVRATRPGIAWPRELNHYRRASVNSFGFGGSNAHAILDNAEHYIQQHGTSLKISSPYVSSYLKMSDMLSGNRASKTAAQRPQVLVFSANDDNSLKRQIEMVSAHLLNPRVKVKLSDLSYTLSNRRSRHFCRAFVLSYPTKTGHASKIRMDWARFAKIRQDALRIGFVFTGQGAQWSQMGAELVRMFPETAKPVLEELDGVLQELPAGIKPEWSLLEELTEPRSSEHLSKPEFSQPLVTALQLAQLAVLESWNVRAEVVVGHSSGEIAAACSAGLMTPRQAILAAYFRGLASKDAIATSPKGMLAVGLGAKDVQPYIDAAKIGGEDVVIACYNSPASVTLSGPSSLLAELEGTIKADGHAARILRVEVAYHSHFMSKIANRYEDLLEVHGGLEDIGKGDCSLKSMVSSVTEDTITRAEVCNAAYWKANMMSPVRFEGACTKMVTDERLAANFLIELGPSNTLAGPISQIVKGVKKDHLTYTAANKRGQEESSRAIFDIAGQLFLHNAEFSLRNVNNDETIKEAVKPAVVVDLPNYQWNHSTEYWDESLASKNWRFKKFPAHDLLGSKALGTLWQSPSWYKLLRLSDVPWLRDHQIGSEILFPAAGYMAMAMEAVRQTVFSTATDQDKAFLKARDYHYCLRDVRFPRGLVLEDDVEAHIMLLLVPMAKLGQGWWEYKVMSLAESDSIASSSSAPSPEKWNLNSTGLVRLELNPDAPLPRAPEGTCNLPLENPTAGQLWYKSMRDAGYSYGPKFQKLLAVEGSEGKTSSRSLISLEPPRSKWEPQSEYPLHPAPLDSCLQSMFTSLHCGTRSNLDKVLVPRSINELVVSGHTWRSGEAVSVTTSKSGWGDASLYDPASGSLIMHLTGLSFSPMMDSRDSVYMAHMYTQLTWKPDLKHLDTDEKLQQALSSVANNDESHVQEILDLAAHKSPNLRVLEFNLVPGNTESLWLVDSTARPIRAAMTEFHFASNSAETVLTAQELYSEWPAGRGARFSVLDPFSKTFSLPMGSSKFDLVVIRWSQHGSTRGLDTLASNLPRLLSKGGNLILYDAEQPGPSESKGLVNGNNPVHALERLNITKIRQTVTGSSIVAEVGTGQIDSPNDDKGVVLVHFSPECSTAISKIASQLRTGGWDLTELYIDGKSGPGLAALPSRSTVLVLDEIVRPLLATATEVEWTGLQTVIDKECDLLWVTQGAQIKPTVPLNAVAHGIFRTVRVEIPMIRIVTLDVESAATESLTTNINAIDVGLRELKSMRTSSLPAEGEIAERHGLLHLSRVLPDEGVNKRKAEDNSGGPPPVMTDFHHSKTTIRVVTDRPGSLEALHFAEDELGGSEAQVMGPDQIVVELFASGCNYQDVVDANSKSKSERRGYEGAGVVVRVGDAVPAASVAHRVGQRVAVFGQGCFANRVAVSPKACFAVPDDIPFQDAATLPVAFLTAIYALRHLARLQKGQRVLIHSACVDVGVACIRLSQRLNCDIFATVDSPEQRQFLANEVGLPEDRILSSEPTALPRVAREATRGHGLDVIISQSTNANLDYENSRLLAPGGTLVRIANGGADAGNLLSTDSFAANCSFQSLDITTLPLETIASVLTELSQLIAGGYIEPISPCKALGYGEIPEALRLIREGNQIGKIVISDDLGTKLAVSTRPATYSVKSLLNPNQAYLFVGGLKGICGSLAIHLASQGAKHIAIMSRSGYQDNVSQSIARNIRALGCSLDLIQGDVNSVSDVRRCFAEISVPVGGIIQGAAVFRDRTFESMSHADYHAALSCKVTGTSNLHFISIETKQPITFFTMLSSISGVVGQKGQSNYAGGNAFEDAFAEYRRSSGLPAISIDLGPIEDVGVMYGNDDLQSRFDGSTLFGINEGLLRRIFDYSFLQQHPVPHHRLNHASHGQMITSLVVPQPEDSELLGDVRFKALRVLSADRSRSRGNSGKDNEVQILLQLTQSSDPDRAAVRSAAVTAVGARLAKQLRLTVALDPARPLLQYGMDSLAAVELRNWVRMILGVELTTLDVANAASLGELCDKVTGKMRISCVAYGDAYGDIEAEDTLVLNKSTLRRSTSATSEYIVATQDAASVFAASTTMNGLRNF
ncbi:Lovastatin nonaketide synthase [Venustampulla echinocandica]|uniref:Lovastatin nonaketide synthase n=1 Tax=Venustampulla echinocandica TaxID=2656787 RepID=A0A370TAR3_9HELO|nr:Lovastatin nonaketide synthase [Venustampulla echinocandica]RDL31023.1 Lovastatin nonaketide synthase [Venustampulla echinocandica]